MVRMSTIGSDASTPSSAWIATLLRSCWSTLLPSRAEAVDIPTTASSDEDKDKTLATSGSCSLLLVPRGSQGARCSGVAPGAGVINVDAGVSVASAVLSASMPVPVGSVRSDPGHTGMAKEQR